MLIAPVIVSEVGVTVGVAVGVAVGVGVAVAVGVGEGLLVVDELEMPGQPGAKVSAALEEGEKSEIRVIQTRYYGVVSARVTCYSIGSEACALLAGLSQPVIGVDRSSDSEVFRVTRGIG